MLKTYCQNKAKDGALLPQKTLTGRAVPDWSRFPWGNA